MKSRTLKFVPFKLVFISVIILIVLPRYDSLPKAQDAFEGDSSAGCRLLELNNYCTRGRSPEWVCIHVRGGA